MSRVTRIEAALKQLDQAGFQRLADAVLSRLGYGAPVPVGIAFGTEKTSTGTPDTIFIRQDGRYVFAEYTTQQQRTAAKLADDVAKCLDEEKTGVAVAKIAEIVVCHTGRMSTAEHDALRTECAGRGIMFSMFNTGTLAQALAQMPDLVREYLGIPVDTGQILSPFEFVTAYGRGGLATPLDTDFMFREEELASVLSALAAADIVVLTGRPGVGKSRLALECLARYCEQHRGTEPWCVFNRGGADLFEDLKTHFAAPRDYLVLVDDANRLTRFEYAVDLLRDNRPGRQVKLLVTVRDYALDQVLAKAQQLGGAEAINVPPLTKEQVRELVGRTCGIQHHAYLDRIVEVAGGNPRLALMAGRVATEHASLQALSDASTIYHEYFRSVRDDLRDLEDPDALRTAGLISFFRTVDRSNAELLGLISDAFGVDADQLWRIVQRLHELELVDLYANEVVRISDQVLATYLFYLAAIERKTLSLAVLLRFLFPRFRHRVVEALNPVFSIFRSEEVAEAARPAVLEALNALEQARDQDAALQLLDTFALLLPGRALAEARRMILAMETAGGEMPTVLEVGQQEIPRPSPLSLIAPFARGGDDERKIALEILVEYVTKTPADAPRGAKVLDESFGIRRMSYMEGFWIQRQSVAVLNDISQGGRDPVAARLLIAYANRLLQTEFDEIESGGRSITHYRFVLPPTDELLQLRSELWSTLRAHYGVASLQPAIEALLLHYVSRSLRADASDVLKHEVGAVESFMVEAFDGSNFRHLHIGATYLDRARRLELSDGADLEARLQGEHMRLFRLFTDDWDERVEVGWEEARRLKGQRINAYARDLGPGDMRWVFARASELRAAMGTSHEAYQVESGITDIFVVHLARDPQAAVELLREELGRGGPAGLQRAAVAHALVQALGTETALDFLASFDYPEKRAWRLTCFQAVAPEEVARGHLERIRALLLETPTTQLPYRSDVIARLASNEPEWACEVIRDLVSRAREEPEAGGVLAGLFDVRDAAEQAGLFCHDVDLMKEAYFAANAVVAHIDHDASVFNAILSADPEFAGAWVRWKHDSKSYVTRHDDHRDYSTLWDRADHAEVMNRIVLAAFELAPRFVFYDSYLGVFFQVREGRTDSGALEARQDAFLDDMIRRHCDDAEMLMLLFSVVASAAPERRLGRLATLLESNPDFAVFERLPLEPSSSGWSGSAVPYLSRRIEYYESILGLLGTAGLVEHRARIEERIEELKQRVEKERKVDFLEES